MACVCFTWFAVTAAAGTDVVTISFEVEADSTKTDVSRPDEPPIPTRIAIELKPEGSGLAVVANAVRGGQQTFKGVGVIAPQNGSAKVEGVLTFSGVELGTNPDDPLSLDEVLALPLPYRYLTPISAALDLEVEVGRLVFGKALYDSVRGQVRSTKPGESRATFVAQGPGGLLKATVSLNGRQQSVRGEFNARDLTPGQWPWFREGDQVLLERAVTDVDASLDGNGGTIGELAGTLVGTLVAEVGEGRVMHDGVRSLGTGVGLLLLEALNPFADPSSTANLRCAVIRARFDDGIGRLNRSLALETDRASLIASGLIDLDARRVEVMAQPSAAGGLTPKVGELSGAIRIEGPLNDPSVTVGGPSPLKLGATIATGGQTWLLRSLLSPLTRALPPCATARAARLEPAKGDEYDILIGPSGSGTGDTGTPGAPVTESR